LLSREGRPDWDRERGTPLEGPLRRDSARPPELDLLDAQDVPPAGLANGASMTGRSAPLVRAKRVGALLHKSAHGSSTAIL
jgi:hypothetical protein